MPLTVEYSSMRAEVWSWYWRAWKRRLWRIHLLLFVMTALSVYLQTFTKGKFRGKDVNTTVYSTPVRLSITPATPPAK